MHNGCALRGQTAGSPLTIEALQGPSRDEVNMIQDLINNIRTTVIAGEEDLIAQQVQAALEAGVSTDSILQQGLIAAMDEVGRLFQAGDYFVPEMLVAGTTMQTGLAVLKPRLLQAGVRAQGKVVLGTVKGDLHDVGKNLVAMMLEGAGFEVIDLGIDVAPERFVAAVRAHQPQLVGLSALLTTTLPTMDVTIKAIVEAGLRDHVKILVGGAPVTDKYARQIGADGFGADAAAAVRLAKALARLPDCLQSEG